jgi:hypothetical protein
MKRLTCAALLVLSLAPRMTLAQDSLPPAARIAQATLAAPDDLKAGAAVMGWDDAGKFVTFRPGSNDLICLADNPKVEGISVACYHKDLDAFMARGREMTASGITDDKVRDQTRWKEVTEGKLAMPKTPTMLYVTTGKSYDVATNTIAESYTRWVVYVPFATAATTGLQTKPGAPGVPWLMDPGTAGAHIMISPPRPGAPK